MQKKSKRTLLPQLILTLVAFVLLFIKSGYFPLNALRSIQITRSFNSGNIKKNSIIDLNLLEQAILMSPGNCEAYKPLGIKYIEYAFPKINTEINYSANLRQKDENHDKVLSAKILSILDSGLDKCARDELNLRFLRGYIYYLIDEPYLAIQELDVFREYDAYDKSQSAQAFEIMSESFNDLQNPTNAAITLIISLSEQHKDNVSEDMNKISTIDSYLKSASVAILPNCGAGFGRYATATKIDGQLGFLGVLSGSPSALIYSQTNNGNIFTTGKVLDATDSNTVGADVMLDKDGNTHIVYLFGERYIIYANSMDEFTKKIIIDSQNTSSSLVDQPNSKRLDSVSLAIDQQNRVHLTWSYTSGYIGYTIIKDSNVAALTLIANNAYFPDIEVSNNDTVSMVYNNVFSFPAEFTQVWYLEKNTSGWAKPVQISQSNIWAGAASLTISDDGVLHVFYITGTSPYNMELIHVVRNSQGNWEMPEVVGNQNFRPFNPARDGLSFAGRTAPSVASLPDNRIVVVWRGPIIDGYTEIFGREYVNGKWKQIQILGKIAGQDFSNTQSIILKNENPDIVSLVWSNNGELVFREWKP